MPVLRALLAILLAVTWCSAVMHGELEAIGWMLEHEHQAHHNDNVAGHAPDSPDDHHEQVFARDILKDQVRLGVSGVLWFSVVGLLAALGFNRRFRDVEDEAIPIRRQSDPPLAQTWQFVWRCAPESAAPPALS